MYDFFVGLTLFGGFILSFGLVSLFVKEQLYISETLVATLFGIICGPKGFDLIQIPEVHKFMFQFSRIVISLQVVAVGVAIPKSYIRREWKSLFMLLGPLMLLTWAISSLIIYYIIGLDLYSSMIIGACVTPTDPVLASTVLKGKFANRYIPTHLRNLIAIESAANDGLGFPLLTYSIIFLICGERKLDAWKKWILETWLREIIFAVFIGAVIGYIARILLKISMENGLIDKESFLVYIIALAILVTGLTSLLHSDDILAAFVCGIFFSWDKSFLADTKNSQILEVLDLLFNLSFFIIFGSMIPWNEFDVRYIAIAGLIILLRRPPCIMAFRNCIPQLFDRRESFFAGWFGPIGVGAIFFAYHAENELKNYNFSINKILIPLVHFIVLSSVVVHGVTAPIIHFHLNFRKKRRIQVKRLDITESEYTEADNIEL
ncbi:Na(+)/H(+) antiporter 1 [Astathelohania contejeani]|uniref:Na(+)/H(+) antiporter 1 n=1 Tax=Astathelohania contejeani TaxID=164912 RepID=A0ABQ7HXB0_9MICR|nr:Na(+)/H(+) antiporter 1 [Thelohania contejeani]